MSNVGTGIHQVEPREQVGPQTGEAFEYQYHQAAAEALALLDDEKVACLYCEWHDDYVTEEAVSGRYHFHQVKTRAKSKGPWRMGEFFGLSKKSKKDPTPPAHADSIFGHLWDHTRKFGSRCAAFSFVTEAGVESDFDTFLSNIRGAKDRNSLSGEDQATLTKLATQLTQTFTDLSEDSLFLFLARMSVADGVGTLKDLGGCRVIIASRILAQSEVDLAMSEARKIGEDIVSAVRARSHKVLSTLPSSIEELRREKGLLIENVLPLLSLSSQGYKQLKKGGRESVLALSRLHRLCKRSQVPDALIPDLCGYKTSWDAWLIDQRHRIADLDFLALKARCVELLKAHSAGSLPIEELVKQARAVAADYQDKLTSTKTLNGELILGFVLALAAEAEV